MEARAAHPALLATDPRKSRLENLLRFLWFSFMKISISRIFLLHNSGKPQRPVFDPCPEGLSLSG
jgi:hypothetical protein